MDDDFDSLLSDIGNDSDNADIPDEVLEKWQ